MTKLSEFADYLRDRQAAASPIWIPASVLLREIKAKGYRGGASQLRAHMHRLKAARIVEDPVVRFETAPGEQTQVDRVDP